MSCTIAVTDITMAAGKNIVQNFYLASSQEWWSSSLYHYWFFKQNYNFLLGEYDILRKKYLVYIYRIKDMTQTIKWDHSTRSKYISPSTGMPLKGRSNTVWNSCPCYYPRLASSEAVLVSLKLMDFQYVGEFITHSPPFE